MVRTTITRTSAGLNTEGTRLGISESVLIFSKARQHFHACIHTDSITHTYVHVQNVHMHNVHMYICTYVLHQDETQQQESVSIKYVQFVIIDRNM